MKFARGYGRKRGGGKRTAISSPFQNVMGKQMRGRKRGKKR